MSLLPKNKATGTVMKEQSIVPLRHSEPNLRSGLSDPLDDILEVTFHDELICNDNNINSAHGKQIDSLSVVMSALYCKLVVVFGIALPVTQIISNRVSQLFYQGFYIYLYGGSLMFISSLHLINFSNSAFTKLFHYRKSPTQQPSKVESVMKQRINNYGSFYLRVGVSVFAIGSMVYSGLEIGEYFVNRTDLNCSNSLLAVKPALRMLFTLFQLHFIFLSDKSMDVMKNQIILRFSLAHMLATNLCEWLSVIIEETSHEIKFLSLDQNGTSVNHSFQNCNLPASGIFIHETSSYLFPCTIEYSLICAVTLVEMWKNVHIESSRMKHPTRKLKKIEKGSGHLYSVDCAHSQRGFICGIMFIVYTVITLIIYFSLRSKGYSESIILVQICEKHIYVFSVFAMVLAAIKMRNLPYCIHRLDSDGSLKLGLDLTLLFKAQIGVYLYSAFSIFANFHSLEGEIWPDVFSLVQTTLQTLFIIDTWWKRCKTKKEQTSKPGREMITFLRAINVALWIINITEKNRAQFKPIQLGFFGLWTWVIITHVSMPLAIFYRFHSVICLFEIWKNAYKDVSVDVDSVITFK